MRAPTTEREKQAERIAFMKAWEKAKEKLPPVLDAEPREE